ncbi:hypothetical protein HYX07_00575, partial [Candidatus Woesearchaeota archaeon]|nr:hypothetical protein [Candidatus Woesearchaeota archaeon]
NITLANGTLYGNLSRNLIAYWNFNEISGNRADSAGTNTLVDQNTVTFNPGVQGNAAQFTAANSETLNISDNTDISTGDIDFTLAAWFYLDSYTGNSGFIFSRREAGEAGEYIMDQHDGAGTYAFKVYGSDGGTIGSSISSTKANIGQWYLAIGWHDSVNNEVGISIRPYNGSETVNTGATIGAVADSILPLTIGGMRTGNYFNGRIDEAAFWKRVLTAQDRADLFNYGQGITYPFNYTTKGNFTSQVFDILTTANWTYISWQNVTPANTSLVLKTRTSADNITWSDWLLHTASPSVISQNSSNRYLQYAALFNSTNASITPYLLNVTLNYTGIFTDNFGNYNYTLTAGTTATTYSVKVNATYADTIPGEALTTFRIISVPIINTNITIPTYPRFNQNVTFQVNVTDADNNILYINFTLKPANGTIINLTNGTRVGDLHNVSFNLTNYGTWIWNVSVTDADGFIVNMTGTGNITLMQITENLNASVVPSSAMISVSGHINLSEGTNVANAVISIFLDDVLMGLNNLTAFGNYIAKQFVDDSDSDFNKGAYNNTRVVGTGAIANVTLNTTNDFRNDPSLVAWWKLDEGSRVNRTDSSFNGRNLLNDSTGVDAAAASFDLGADFEADEKDSLNISDSDQSGLDLTGNMTLLLWLKPESATFFIPIGKTISTGGGWEIQHDTRAGMETVYFVARDSGGSTIINTASSPEATPVVGRMTHWAVVFNDTDGSVEFYQNGTYIKTVVDAGDIPDTTHRFILGARVDGSYYDGIMDDVVIFNRTLKPSEIQSIYNQSLNRYNISKTANFTSQVFDANAVVNWSYISWYQGTDDKGISNLYQQDLGGLINGSTVLYMKFNNDTLESEKQLNATHNISAETNLVLYMPFDSASARELKENGSTVLLMHFNNDTGTGENASLFLNNATDSTGAGLPNGTCILASNQCPVYQDNNTKLGKSALNFDDSNDFINVSDNDHLDLAGRDLTLEAWIKTTGNGMILDKRVGQAGYFMGVGVAVSGNEEKLQALTNGNPNQVTSNKKVTDDQWHHVAAVLTGSTITLYIDGAVDTASSSGGGTANATTAPLLIGRGTGGDFFGGQIDEVAIWNISLSSQIIAQHSGYGIDRSIYGNNATFINRTTINQSGKFGEAMTFRGSSNEAGVPLTESYLDTGFKFSNNTNITIEFWANVLETANAARYVLSDRNSEATRTGFDISYDTTPGWQGVGPGGVTWGGGFPKINLNTWQHIAVQIIAEGSSSRARLYKDGVLVAASATTSSTYTTSGETLVIGMNGHDFADTNNNNRWFNGTIDEFAVWNNTILSSDKISQHAGAKIIDYSQYGNNGTRFSNASSDFGRNFTDGKFSKALLFDGVNDYVNSTVNLTGKSAATLEAWVNPSSFGTSGDYMEVIISSDLANNLLMRLGSGVAGQNTRIRFCVNNNCITSGANSYVLNQWQHLVSTWDGSTGIIYKDGLQIVSGTINEPSIRNHTGMMISSARSVSSPFNGTIDEVAIWNISLSDSEIRKHYERGVLKLNVSYRTSNDSSTFSQWKGLSNSTLSTTGELSRYFQYKADFNTTDARYTPILNNVTVNYTGIFTDALGNYNYTLTAPTGATTYSVKVNATSSNIPGEQLQSFRVTSIPVINANYTIQTFPRFGRTAFFVANVTDADNTVVYVNFTLTAPNGSFVNISSGAKVGDLYNASYNLTNYGEWKWNVTVFDSDGFLVNSTSTGIITLMQVNMSLNITAVRTGDSVGIFGHINLSNGSNFSNSFIGIFLNEILMGINNLTAATGYLAALDKQFIEDDDSEFNLTVRNATKVVGTGTLANVTLADWDYDPDGNLTANLMAYWKLDEPTGTQDRKDTRANNTLKTNGSLTSVPGIKGSATQFTSANIQFLNISDNPDLSTGDIDFTIAAWAYLDSNNEMTIISKGEQISANQPEYWLKYDSTASRFEFFVSDSSTRTQVDANNSGAASIGRWYHIIAWHDSGANTINISVNNLANGASHTAGSYDSGTSLRMGARAGAGTPDILWNGRIDEVAFWKRLLTQRERDVLFNQSFIDNNWSVAGNTYKPPAGNFSSVTFDAQSVANWSYISWNDVANGGYGQDLSDSINASMVLYMKFNNDTQESEKQLNVTHNISAETNLVLYMPFDSASARELTPNSSTYLLFHFNNDTGTGENASLFLDNSTYKNNGTCKTDGGSETTGCPYYNTSDAKLGNAGMFFNGSVSINTTYIMNTSQSAFTLEAWVKPRAYGLGGSRPNILNNDIQDGGGAARVAGIGVGAGVFLFDTDGGNSGDGTIGVQLNQWHHVAATYDGSTKRLYVNGVLDSFTTSTGNKFSVLNQTYRIGIDPRNNVYFNGTLDEVAIWNITLSSGIIAQHSGYGIDRSNNGNNASLMLGAIVNQTGCKFGECMQFNGSRQFMNVTDSPTLRPNDTISIEFWAKTLSDGGPTDGIVSRKLANGNWVSWEVDLQPGPKIRWQLQNGTNNPAYIQDVPFSRAEWHHFAVTYYTQNFDASDFGIYMDGVKQSATLTANGYNSAFRITYNTSKPDNTILIGASNYDATSTFLNGTIDEVAIWNKTLSADLIAQHAGAKIIDYSNYGNNGTRNFNSSSDFGRNFTDGKFSKALLFDGVNDFVNVSNEDKFDFERTNPFSIEGWVKRNRFGANINEVIVAKGNLPGYQLRIHDRATEGPDSLAFHFGNGGSSVITVAAYSNSELGDTDWHHVVSTYDGSSSASGVKLYVDGIPMGTNTVDDTLSSSTLNNDNLWIGKRHDSVWFFNGTLDEVAIWNVSLDSSLILQHAQRGLTNLSILYSASNDSAAWSDWIHATNSTATATNTLSRYFRYLAKFSTNNTNLTPVLNDVTINYTGIFTDNYGNFNYSFLAPLSAGTYTSKVNATFGNISGEAFQSFSVEANAAPNAPIINAPEAGAFINVNYTILNLTISDNNTFQQTFTCNFYGDNSTLPNGTINASNPISQNGTSVTFNWTNLNQSTYFWKANCEDGFILGENSTTRNFTIDTILPSINFTATLSNGSFVNQNYISINVTLTETNFANITFYLWNGTPTTLLYNETNFTSQTLSINFTNLDTREKSYLINVTARDRASNINSTETRNITLDNMNPRINFTSPTPSNNSRAIGNVRVINLTLGDVSISSCVLQVHNGTDNATNFTMEVRGLNCNVTINTIDGYNYTLKAYVNDTALNSNSTENLTFRENTVPEIPTLNAPANNSRQTSTSIVLNYSSSDNDTDTLNYIVYFDTNTNPVTQVYRGTSQTFVVSTARGTTYYWKVQADDSFENSSNSTTRQFTINSLPPVPYVITPNLTGIQLKGGSTYNVTYDNFTSDADNDNVTITLYYSTDSGLTYPNLIASGLAYNGSYPWLTPSINSNKARIKAITNDSYEFSEDTSDNDFTIDSSAPTITLDNPPNQSSFNNGTFINLTITDNFGVINVTWNNGTLEAANRTDFNGTYDINTTGWGVGDVNISVYANDSVGNLAIAYFRFTVTNVQPVVTFNTPSPNQVIRATFRVNVTNTSQLDDDAFVNFTYAEATQNFTMTKEGTNYFYDFDTTTVTDGQRRLSVYANDSAGNVVRADISATIDNTRPAITLSAPLNDTWKNATVNFVYIPNDLTNIVNCSLIINNTINQSNGSISKGIENIFTNVVLGDGIYQWDVNCTDAAYNNNTNGSFRIVKIDTIAPVITLIDPPNDTSVRGNKTINFSVTDLGGSNVNNASWSSNYLVDQTDFIGSYGINTSLFPEGKTNITIVVNDSAGNKARLLLTYVIDLTPPIVTFNKPTPRQVIRGIFRVNVTATDVLSNVSGLLFAFNGSTNSTMTRVGPEITADYFFDWNTTNASDSEHILKIHGNDTANNIKFEPRFAIVDNTAPAIRLDAPSNDSWSITALTALAFAVFEFNSLNNCTLLINGSINATLQASELTKNSTNTFSVNLSDGLYRWTVNCTDEAVDANLTRNMGTNSSEYLVGVDTLVPQISFATPDTEANDTHFARNYTAINVTITEANFANMTFYLYNRSSLINETNFTSATYFLNFTKLNSDLYFYNVTVRDGASNTNSTETRQISLNERSPSIKRFIITNASGSAIGSIDDKGDMYLLGNKTQALSILNATPSSFVVQNNSGSAIAYVNSTGYLFLKGVLTEDLGIALAGTNLEIVDSNDRVVAVFDNQGNLKLTGLLVEKFANP